MWWRNERKVEIHNHKSVLAEEGETVEDQAQAQKNKICFVVCNMSAPKATQRDAVDKYFDVLQYIFIILMFFE